MKKLLQINSVINSGSTGRIAEEIGQLAIENGWESYIAYGRNERPSKSELIKIGTDWDIKLHGLQTRLFDRHGLGSSISTKSLVNQIKKVKPNIIHLHNLHGYFLNIKVLFNYLKKADIPVVWTFHDCWAMTGHCAYFDYIGCEKWKTGCFSCPQKTSYPGSILFDRSKQNYNLKKTLFNSVKNMTIIPVSNWLNNIVKDSFLSKYPTQVIHNGIDTKVFTLNLNNEKKRKYNLLGKFVILGVASVWSQRKGLSDFLKLSQHLDSNYQIILVGLNSSQLKKLPKNILGITKTENVEELAELYSASDIVLNLSAEETFGLTTVEGFACGTPGIVYNCTASPELITPETGFIVEQGDIEGLLNVINEVKQIGKLYYSTACRERAIKFYNKNDRYMDYLNLYESILNQDTDNQNPLHRGTQGHTEKTL